MLATWAAGLAAGAAVVAWWRVVGRGFVWLAAGVTALCGAVAAAAGGGAAAWAALALTGVAFVVAHRPTATTAVLALATAGYLTAASIEGDALLAITGAVALGGVSSEMILGHWYLVDPRLPRWALRRLDLAAIAGIVLDAGALVARGVLDWAPEDAVLGWAFVALAGFSLVLAVAVWFALREPSYSGVMAATGLSYLAVMTVFGAAVVGRIVSE